VPFHDAIRFTVTTEPFKLFAVTKSPPAMSNFANDVRARTVPSKPPLSGAHAVPFQLAMRRALAVPARVKVPPAYRATGLAHVDPYQPGKHVQ
jgi:hypothetical protein